MLGLDAMCLLSVVCFVLKPCASVLCFFNEWLCEEQPQYWTGCVRALLLGINALLSAVVVMVAAVEETFECVRGCIMKH